MFDVLKQCLKRLIKVLYSPRCHFCKNLSISNNICVSCLQNIPCVSPSPIKIIEGVEVFSAGKYEGNLRTLIKDFKYKHRKNFASDIAIYMNKQLQRLNLKGDYQIVPVPMFYLKEWFRQYNHTDLIAVELAKTTGYSTNIELLDRKRYTKPQYHLTKPQREENLKNAFSVNREKHCGKSILLVDDICTTGSTLREIIRTLKQDGIEDIKVLVTSYK